MILSFVVENFIKTAEPVSSKFLEKVGVFSLSSASIRAEMNELESRGYLVHLYTSSGRLPTDKGYRYFVDNFLEAENLTTGLIERRKIKQAIQNGNQEPRLTARLVAQALSDLTGHLVIANVEEEKRDDFFKVGLSGLFEMPEFREFEKAFRLTRFFDEFDDFFREIEQHFFNDNDFGLFIGRENPARVARDETIILAKHDLPKGSNGSLALIGPTRMDYKRNIGLVKCAMSELNNTFKT